MTPGAFYGYTEFDLQVQELVLEGKSFATATEIVTQREIEDHAEYELWLDATANDAVEA